MEGEIDEWWTPWRASRANAPGAVRIGADWTLCSSCRCTGGLFKQHDVPQARLDRGALACSRTSWGRRAWTSTGFDKPLGDA